MTAATDPLATGAPEQPPAKPIKAPIKLDIIVLRDRLYIPDADISLNNLVYTTKQERPVDITRPPLTRSALVHEARNKAINLIRDDVDYILLIDDDMATDDPRALLKMLEILEAAPERIGALTPLTCKRGFPIQLASSYLEDYNGTLRATAVMPETVQRARDAGSNILAPCLGGGAWLLMRAAAFQKTLAAHLEAKDWWFDHEVQFERMGVGKGVMTVERRRIAELRQQAYNINRHHTLFNHPYDSDCTYLHGEDWALSLFMFRLGIVTAIALDVQVQHCGLFPYSPQLVGIPHWKDLEVPVEQQGNAIPPALQNINL
jgi:glycosyltransferase involved in cell wall biosynthesis